MTPQQIVYWGSWLVFPFLLLLFVLYRRRIRSGLYISLLGLLCLLFIWARFIEPHLLTVGTTQIPSQGLEKRIALISDLHLGVYKDGVFLRRVVDRLNALKPDLVLFAGDFVFHPQEMDRLFAPLANLEMPLYAVLGNHDVGLPGPPVRDELMRVLDRYGVELLQNVIVRFPDFVLVGLGSHWAGEDDVRLLERVSLQDEVVVLAHNPDTISRYGNDKADYTLSGHTHGGQIRIPGLYRYWIPTLGPYDQGQSRERRTRLFISGGLGEIGVPLRFLNPPMIDLLEFRPLSVPKTVAMPAGLIGTPSQQSR